MKTYWLIALVLMLAPSLRAQETARLSAEDIDAILFMREEEKLARDAYELFYVKWGVNPFGHIRFSEQNHMDQVKTLIVSYKLEDPIEKTADEPGKFENGQLQNLYAEVVKEGSTSMMAGLKTGALIEEIDILDLDARMARSQNADIRRVFSYLKRASENHLNAFVRKLKVNGVDYNPVKMNKKQFDEILGGNERGCCRAK
ncbi:MAG TPA: DUF2202 domain-containing protein [Saprospiraceae bacterium]|nr:DUF2202 domain-containing protein [Saprospiraceae bacterium]HNT20663.1 DUF2202 domain-containing protein [Saprospiraceae bacterium]